MSDPLPNMNTYLHVVVTMLVAVVIVVIFINLGLGWEIYGPYPMEMMVLVRGKQKQMRHPCLHTASYQSRHQLLQTHSTSPLCMRSCNSFCHPVTPKMTTRHFTCTVYII